MIWRMSQSDAKCSHVEFPDHQGKYSEFPRFWEFRDRLVAEKPSPSLWFLSEFPTRRIWEFSNVIRESFYEIREFSTDNRGNRIKVMPHQRIQSSRLLSATLSESISTFQPAVSNRPRFRSASWRAIITGSSLSLAK